MLLGGLLCACQEPTQRTLSSKLTLRYLPGCAPERVEGIAVEPLGDFALGERSASVVAVEKAPALLRRLPVETLWYRLGVTTESFRGVALSPVGGEGQGEDALLLPLEQTCGVLDEAVPALQDGMQALVAGRDLLLAGGADAAGDGLQDAALLRVARGVLAADAQGLLVPRARAAAVDVGSETWLVGGSTSLRPGSAALDTFERYEAAQGRFGSLGRLRARRVEPSALRLDDGRVLVVGGRAAVGGAPLQSLETLRADGESTLWAQPLPFAAAGARLALRDDGRVLVAAQEGDGVQLALLEPASGSAAPLDAPTLGAGRALDAQLTVALPGARSALFEVSGGATTGTLHLLLADGTYRVLSDWLASFAELRDARSLALDDGRILLAGVRQGQPVARVIDPGTRAVSSRALDVPVRQLLQRSDGSVLLVGVDGVRILREDARTPYDNPGGTLLAADSTALCLDAHGRFEREGLALRAREAGARFDLAALRYRDVTLDVRVQGAAELIVRAQDGQERTIQVGGAQFGPAFCTLQVEPGRALQVERRAQRITLRVGERQKSCVLDGFDGQVAFALRALERDVLVSDLRIQRD